MHDKNGLPLIEGDEVTVRCRITHTTTTEDEGYCNVTLESIEPMFPTDNPTTIILNAKQVEKCESNSTIAGDINSPGREG